MPFVHRNIQLRTAISSCRELFDAVAFDEPLVDIHPFRFRWEVERRPGMRWDDAEVFCEINVKSQVKAPVDLRSGTGHRKGIRGGDARQTFSRQR